LTAPCSTPFHFFTATITLAIMSDKRFAKRRTGFRASQRIAETILDYVGQTPATTEDWNRKPAARARAIARRAAGQAAVTAGSLTLPPGPLGWLTLLPELRALWKLQTQMVADIAGCHGKTAVLGREEMLYCLFRHTDPQAVRDLVSQIGNRFVVQRAARPEIQSVVLKIGLHISQRLIGKGLSRWIPVFGALGASAYAYYDTARVAQTAIDFFSGIIDEQAEEAPHIDH
jgi:hypothetical protein